MFNSKETERFGTLETPFYYYDLKLLRKTLDEYTSYLHKYNYHAHYAFKANANDRILSVIREYGLGADCVSGNEVALALKSGFSPDKIVYAGVGMPVLSKIIFMTTLSMAMADPRTPEPVYGIPMSSSNP